MKHIDFYLDFISPYAYLAFETLPATLEGVSHVVNYKPVLFAGLLKHHGQLGPAEIAPKRDWTYRQVMWLADRHGVSLRMPAGHPFNSLPLLRLALAAGGPAGPNRWICETIFRHVWQGGAEATDAARLDALAARLAPGAAVGDPGVKSRLQALTDEAIGRGLFGVPSFVIDGRVFWGFDALPMLRDHLLGSPWFRGGDWDAAPQVPVAQARSRPA